MKRSGYKCVAALVCGVFCAAPGLAQNSGSGDPAAGKAKFYTCMGCHGIPGYQNAYPDFSVPKLGGQHAAYIVSALKEYRSGKRSSSIMHAQAASLSDADIQDIAAFLAQHQQQAKRGGKR